MEWNLVGANHHALASSRVMTNTVSASDVWAWSIHETLSLAFLTTSTARILLLKPCALDSRFLITAQILRSRTLFETVSFGLEDILYTVASGSEDIGATSFDVFSPGSQEAWLSPAYPELVDVLAHATKKLSLDWPDEPRESQHFLSGSGSRPMKRKLSESRDFQVLEAALLLPPH